MPDGEIPMSGAIPYAVGTGMASKVRIPVPGHELLAIEFSPRNFNGTSSSTLFIQNAKGKGLRLDYGFNKRSMTVDYHWNQEGGGVHAKFGVENHQTTGRFGKIAYKAAKYFKYAGRFFMVAGAVFDGYSIVVADKPIRRATEVVSAWALAYIGCTKVGPKGVAVGSRFGVYGTAIGGVVACIIGGAAGYQAGEKISAVVYDWVEDTIFTPVHTTAEAPPESFYDDELQKCVTPSELTKRQKRWLE